MAAIGTTAGAPRLSLGEYEALLRAGSSAVPTELLDGLVVPKMTKGLRHMAVTRRLRRLLDEALPPGLTTFKEDAIALPVAAPEGGGSLPEPDLTVVRGMEADYDGRYATPEDVVLVVEVASDPRMLARDHAGLARYARNRVPAVWVVNLAATVVEVYQGPSGPGEEPVYERVEYVAPGASLVLADGGNVLARLDAAEILA